MYGQGGAIDMHVVKLEVSNYGPFKGVHLIELGPTVYGVVGRHADDPGRSNWLGKSWVLGAIRFALYGAHGATSEDAIIHNGEDECRVEVTMDDGTAIRRSRKQGKSTQLMYATLGGNAATQKRAQELIDDYMKMSLEDFDASCFIEQKQIARMVTATPADRTKIVNAWLELGPLQDAASYASDHLRTLLATKSRNTQTHEATLAAFEDFDLEVEETKHRQLTLKIEGMAELRGILKEQIQDGLDWEREKQRADEFEHLLGEGKSMAQEGTDLEVDISKFDSAEASEQATQDASLKVHDTSRDYSADQILSSGEFGGQCPVMKRACPVPGDVTATKLQAKHRLPMLSEACKVAGAAYDKVHAAKLDRLAFVRGLESVKLNLIDIRKDAHERVSAADFIADNPDPINVESLQVKEEGFDTTISNLKSEKTLLEGYLKSYKEAKLLTEQHGPAIKKLDNDIRTAQEAVAILGRGGAQKEIASAALSAIETLANGLLSKASIDLTLAVRWAREGKGLATHCDACGTPFGTSARVKACPSCNSARGPKMIDKLELELSNRSGAADDMAGLAFQLAASSWLRKKRGSDWSVVFIDEPFGALDETNSANLSNHLHTLIRGQFGFEQGFLVSHGQQIMSAMPSRVVVKSDGVSSSLGVE